jgi:signal transduction histidine kinase
MAAAWRGQQAVAAGAEDRMAQFTELVATAIGNAEGRAELAASRARIVTASDATRRRIERDLHDGAQQRLVSLTLALRAAQATIGPGQEGLRSELEQTADGLVSVLEDLQEMSRGIHPAILSKGGLGPALKTLARRSAVPVELDVQVDARLPEPVEAAAYYVVSEALANAVKHARASVVTVTAAIDGATVVLAVRDDGIGGSDPSRGSGLTGLRDRVEALGGTLEIDSGVGRGTVLRARIPVRPPPLG